MLILFFNSKFKILIFATSRAFSDISKANHFFISLFFKIVQIIAQLPVQMSINSNFFKFFISKTF